MLFEMNNTGKNLPDSVLDVILLKRGNGRMQDGRMQDWLHVGRFWSLKSLYDLFLSDLFMNAHEYIINALISRCPSL